MNESKKEINLLELIPRRLVSYEASTNGHITITKAKFKAGFLKKVEKYLPNPNYKIHLDEVGSFIWILCDGKRNVGKICEMLCEKFGEKVDPVTTRTSQFIIQLTRNHLITLESPKDRPSQTQ